MLAPTLLQPLLASLSRTLTPGDTDNLEAAAVLLASFHPTTPIQAMLAAQAIALHHAAMDCFARAMAAEPEDHATANRLHRNATSLTRAFAATLRTLQRCQAEAARDDHMQREAGRGRGVDGEFPAPWADAGREQTPTGGDPSTPPADPLPEMEAEFSPPPPSHSSDPSSATASPQPPSAPLPRTSHQKSMQPEEPAHRAWENLTEAEQFAILYPDRVAAGATSHEHADLWLPSFTGQPNPPRLTR